MHAAPQVRRVKHEQNIIARTGTLSVPRRVNLILGALILISVDFQKTIKIPGFVVNYMDWLAVLSNDGRALATHTRCIMLSNLTKLISSSITFYLSCHLRYDEDVFTMSKHISCNISSILHQHVRYSQSAPLVVLVARSAIRLLQITLVTSVSPSTLPTQFGFLLKFSAFECLSLYSPFIFVDLFAWSWHAAISGSLHLSLVVQALGSLSPSSLNDLSLCFFHEDRPHVFVPPCA